MKLFFKPIILLLSVLFHFSAMAEPESGDWIADKSNGCKVWNPEPSAEKRAYESIDWSGECINGLASGEGTLQWYLKGNLHVINQGKMKKGKFEIMNKWVRLVPNTGDLYEKHEYQSLPDNKFVDFIETATISRLAYKDGSHKNKGKWINNEFIMRNLFKNDRLIHSCRANTTEECLIELESRK